MGFITSCCRCGRRLTIVGLCGLPLMEACEFCQRAEPPPPPPAVREMEAAQFHAHAEMDTSPLVMEPGTIVASGAIGNGLPPRPAMVAQPEAYWAVSSGSTFIAFGGQRVTIVRPT